MKMVHLVIGQFLNLRLNPMVCIMASLITIRTFLSGNAIMLTGLCMAFLPFFSQTKNVTCFAADVCGRTGTVQSIYYELYLNDFRFALLKGDYNFGEYMLWRVCGECIFAGNLSAGIPVAIWYLSVYLYRWPMRWIWRSVLWLALFCPLQKSALCFLPNRRLLWWVLVLFWQSSGDFIYYSSWYPLLHSCLWKWTALCRNNLNNKMKLFLRYKHSLFHMILCRKKRFRV